MSWTHVGSKRSPAEAATFSVVTVTAGDIVLLSLVNTGTSTVTGVSGGGCTWRNLVPDQAISVLSGFGSVWLGTVTTPGTANVTVTFSGATPGTIRPNYDEFTCSDGAAAVSLDNFQILNSAAHTATMPTATPSGTGELYWGYAHDAASSVVGTNGVPAGMVYEVDANGNGTNYDLSVSAPVAAVWGDSSHDGGIFVLVTSQTTQAQALGDAGSGADAVTLSVTGAVADTGAAADVLAVPAQVLALSDAGTGTDAPAVSVAGAAGDSGAGADVVTVAVLVTLADAGAGTDATTVAGSASVQLSEAGTGTDQLAVSAALPAADTGAGTDAAAVTVLLVLADAGAGADLLKTGGVFLADAGSAADALALGAVTLALADAGAGADFISASGGVPGQPGLVQVYSSAPQARPGNAAPSVQAFSQAPRVEAGNSA